MGFPTSHTGIRLGVVLPLANEADVLAELLSRLFAQLGPNDRVFAVADHASKDQTPRLLAEAAQREPRLLYVWAPENRCVVDAYVRGYREALAADCRWILEMDGGLSHAPECIPRYLALMEAGADYVGGTRFVPGGKFHGSLQRWMVSRGGSWIINRLLGTRMSDMTSGFECFTHAALKHALDHGLKSRGPFFQSEIRARMHAFNWAEVPIEYKVTSGPRSVGSITDAFRCLFALRKELAGRLDGKPRLASVVTTIQTPTRELVRHCRAVESAGGRTIIVGDQKGPAHVEGTAARLIPLSEQGSLGFALAGLLPRNHYSRKNLGYLAAIGSGARCLHETDDDNAPLDGWRPRELQVRAARAPSCEGWVNIYRLYSEERLWPRGFPLDLIARHHGLVYPEPKRLDLVTAPLQQALANGNPDVDAVWRLTTGEPELRFRPGPSYVVAPGVWTPLNSQATWWWPAAWPFLYLPSHCSFRMTDIWRGFVAQRCLWELGHGVVVHPAEVYQARNPHSLMNDFKQEISGYENNRKLTEALAAAPLARGPGNEVDNLIRCYEALTRLGLFPKEELALVRAWAADLSAVQSVSLSGKAA